MCGMSGNLQSDQVVAVETDSVTLEGSLRIPAGAPGLVAFAHGSGSSRHSPRNQFVARELHKARLGTLLFDLLTPQEDQVDRLTRRLRFNIPLLAERLSGATEWLRNQPDAAELPIGYFGASTGSAAALIAAVERADDVKAVVSRGGRPDLAEEALAKVAAPTLFIVGGNDTAVLEMNRRAMNMMQSTKSLEVVPGASHLFEEPGALDQVAALTRDWFCQWLGK